MKIYYSLCFFFVALHVHGQVTIASGTDMAAVDGTTIVMETVGNLANGSTFDFSNTNLTVSLISNVQAISGPWVVTQLNVVAGSNKDITGNLTVTQGITFNNGLLTPQGSGKILYTGSADNITGDFTSSYVNGVFHVKSDGRMFFPVGASGLGYAPAWIESGNGTDEVGMEVINSGAGLAFDPSASEIQAVDNTHYWQVSGADLVALSSAVTLSMNGIASFGGDLGVVVVQAGSTGEQAENLLSASSDGVTVTSRKAVTKPVLAVAGSKEIELRIHDIITPFTAGDNDELYIENIEKFTVNKVTLLDRWGAPVKEWKNFTNYTDPLNPNQDGYEFTKLSPGNYICVVEYGDAETGMSKKSQMITVLKAK